MDYLYIQVVLLLLSPEYLTLNEDFYSPNKNIEQYNVKKVLMQNEQLEALLEDRTFVGIDNQNQQMHVLDSKSAKFKYL